MPPAVKNLDVPTALLRAISLSQPFSLDIPALPIAELTVLLEITPK